MSQKEFTDMPVGIKGFQKGHKGFIAKERYIEIAKKISISNRGKVRTAEHRKNISIAAKNREWKPDEKYRETMRQHALRRGFGKIGRVWTIEERLKSSASHKGSKAPAWKGGISPLHSKIRGSVGYRIWRSSVYARDHYTCKLCGKKNEWDKEKKRRTGIHAHHIKPFCNHPELRFDVNNGMTLCIPCHIKVHSN